MDTPSPPSTLCGACSAVIEPADRYCRACGSQQGVPASLGPAVIAQVRDLISLEVEKLTKDRKVVEYEVSESIANRLFSWAKLFGAFVAIPATIILLGLSFLGIRSIDTFINEIEKTKQATIVDMEKRRSTVIAEADATVGRVQATTKSQVARLEKSKTEVEAVMKDSRAIRSKINEAFRQVSLHEANLKQLQQQFSRSAEKVNGRVDQLQSAVAGFGNRYSELLDAFVNPDGNMDLQNERRLLSYMRANGVPTTVGTTSFIFGKKFEDMRRDAIKHFGLK